MLQTRQALLYCAAPCRLLLLLACNRKTPYFCQLFPTRVVFLTSSRYHSSNHRLRTVLTCRADSDSAAHAPLFFTMPEASAATHPAMDSVSGQSPTNNIPGPTGPMNDTLLPAVRTHAMAIVLFFYGKTDATKRPPNGERGKRKREKAAVHAVDGSAAVQSKVFFFKRSTAMMGSPPISYTVFIYN